MTVIVHIMGGLGNQLFQYTAGRSLSLLHEQELILERNWYHQDFTKTDLTAREFMLGNYNIRGTEKAISLSKLRLWRETSLFSPLSATLRTEDCSPEFFYRQKPRRRTLLDGYWTKPEYFLPFSGILRTELTLKTSLPKEAETLCREFDTQPYIGVHVRLGDKARASSQQRYSTSLEYLKAAVDTVRMETGVEKAVLFSDNPEYCRKNLATELSAKVVSGTWNEAIELLLFQSAEIT